MTKLADAIIEAGVVSTQKATAHHNREEVDRRVLWSRSIFRRNANKNLTFVHEGEVKVAWYWMRVHGYYLVEYPRGKREVIHHTKLKEVKV